MSGPAPVELVSFGYGHGPAPDAHLTVDVRHHFRDPHVSPELRHLTAADERVVRAVLDTTGVPLLVRSIVLAAVVMSAHASGRARGSRPGHGHSSAPGPSRQKEIVMAWNNNKKPVPAGYGQPDRKLAADLSKAASRKDADQIARDDGHKDADAALRWLEGRSGS